MYLARVAAMTSSGRGGGDARRGRSQPERSAAASRGRTACRTVRADRPVARWRHPRTGMSRGQHLVGEHDRPVAAPAELKLRIGQQQAAIPAMPSALAVHRQGQVANLPGPPAPHPRLHPSKSIASSCCPSGALVVGVKIGSGSRDPSTSPPAAQCRRPSRISCTRPSQIRSDSRAPRTRPESSPAARRSPLGRRPGRNVGRDHVILHQAGKSPKPPLGQLVQDQPLSGIRLSST